MTSISLFASSRTIAAFLIAVACCALVLCPSVAGAQNAAAHDPAALASLHARMRSMFGPEPTVDTHYRKIEGDWTHYIHTRLTQNIVEVSQDFETACEHAMANRATAKDGSSLVHHYIVAFAVSFSNLYSPDDWPKALQKVKSWRAAYPQSKCAPLAEAKYWRSYAWYARGHGYSDSVEKEGWDLFGERVQKSYDVAMESKSLAASNPVWYSTIVLAALDLGMPMTDVTRFVGQSIQQHPGYWQTSFNISTRLSPKWGASWKDHDDYVRSVSKLAAPDQRDEVYASHYWHGLEMGELRDYSAMDWSRVKAGMKVLIAKLPDDTRYLNAYAVLACGAHDGDAYSSARFQIKNERYFPRIWPRGMTMEVCDRRSSWTNRFKRDLSLGWGL